MTRIMYKSPKLTENLTGNYVQRMLLVCVSGIPLQVSLSPRLFPTLLLLSSKTLGKTASNLDMNSRVNWFVFLALALPKVKSTSMIP